MPVTRPLAVGAALAALCLAGCKDRVQNATKEKPDARVLGDELTRTPEGRLKGRVQIRNVGADGQVQVKVCEAFLAKNGKHTVAREGDIAAASSFFSRDETRWVDFDVAAPAYPRMIIVVSPSGGANWDTSRWNTILFDATTTGIIHDR